MFGKVVDDQMVLSHPGKITDECRREIPRHSTNVELGAHVVMPNHVHGILNLHTKTPFESVQAEVAGAEALEHAVEVPETIGHMRFQQPGKNTVSSMIGGFKSAVSKEATKAALHLRWQSRFQDHIIRDTDEYQRITDYILNNPSSSPKDKFYCDPNRQ